MFSGAILCCFSGRGEKVNRRLTKIREDGYNCPLLGFDYGVLSLEWSRAKGARTSILWGASDKEGRAGAEKKRKAQAQLHPCGLQGGLLGWFGGLP